MSQMIKYLIINRCRYYRHFLKTFAPVLLIMAILLGAFIYTNGATSLNILLSISLEDYSVYVFIILSLAMIAVSLFSIKSGVYIYHATIHYFYNTDYLLQLLFCMYLKKLVGCFIVASAISYLVSDSMEKFAVASISITTYMFSLGMLQWFKFNARNSIKWIISGLMLSGLFVSLRENFFWIGILTSICILAYTRCLHINYTKWIEECSFVDESSFASAKQNISRMYHVQSMVRARNFHKTSYPIWELCDSNTIVQKTVIKMLREPKRIWVIWAIPFISSIAIKILWKDFPYVNIVMGLAASFFLSGINQYLYNDFFELLNKAKKGLFLPYSNSLIIAQEMVVPTVIFFTLAIIVLVFTQTAISKAFLLFLGWTISYLLIILYKIFSRTSNRFIMAAQSALIVSLTLWAVI